MSSRAAARGNGANAYLDPMQSFGYLARINFRLFSRLLEQRTLPHGVSAGQWRFLRVLWSEDNLTQRELSRRAGTREASTVRAVRSLVEAGYVRRVPCPEDRRKIYVTLTAKGRGLRARLMPLVAEVNAIAIEGIDPAEVAIARRVLARTCANLEAQLVRDDA